MGDISAKLVKELRDQTQLPMMDCKKALQETAGDIEAAVQWLRERGKKVMGGRADRATEEGRIAIHATLDSDVGTMIELQCESAPVASNEEFVQLANDMATQLATGPGAATPEELLAQPSPSKSGVTLQEQVDDLANRIREVFRLTRLLRVDRSSGGYVHHDGKTAVLLEVEGGNADAARDVSMHIAAMKPRALNIEDLDPAEVQKERDILMNEARAEGKPENIIEKMVEGRLRKFYAESVLLEQPFVKDDKQSVGKYAKGAGMKLAAFHRWQLGQS